MPEKTLRCRPPITRGLILIFVLFAAAPVLLLLAVLSGSRSGIGMLIVTTTMLLFYVAVLAVGGHRLALTPTGIRLNRQKYGWDALIGLEIEERGCVGSEPLLTYTLLLAGAGRFVFDSSWRGSYRVAASLQRGRFDPAATIDRREVVAAPMGLVPAIALDVPQAWVDRWLDVVTALLAEVGLAAAVDRRTLATNSDNPFLDLWTAARATIRADEAAWPALLRAHVERALRMQAELRWFWMGDDFARARPLLRVQLHARGRVPDDAGVREDYGPDLCFVLVARLECGETAIDARLVAAWGRPDGELLAIGHANLAADPPPAQEPAPDPDRDPVLFEGEDEFMAARITRLDTLVAVDEQLGALVAVPSTNTLVIQTLRAPAELEWFGGALTGYAETLFHEEMRPISDAVYWWRLGAPLVKLGREDHPDGPVPVLPDELRRCLTRSPV